MNNFKPVTDSSLRANLRAVWLKALPVTQLTARYPIIKYGPFWYIDINRGPFLLNTGQQLGNIPVLSLAARLNSLQVEVTAIASTPENSLAVIESYIIEIKAKVQAEILKFGLPNSSTLIKFSTSTTTLL